MSGKYWCFTVNNPTLAEKVEILPEGVSYCIYQLEEGQNGTPHYQGYVELTRPQRISWLKRHLFLRGHYERRRGTASQAAAYCKKNEGRLEGPFELGEMIEQQQGRRSDLERAIAMVRDGKSDWDLMQEVPSVMARYSSFIRTYRVTMIQELVIESMAAFVPRPGWQTRLDAKLRGPVCSRSIYVVYDDIGDRGKSYFAERYDARHSFIVSHGRFEDIVYGFIQRDNVKYVFFDYGRDGRESFPYRIVEKFKDGCMTSSKYESRTVYFAPVHVVIMTNWPIDRTRLSLDRWVDIDMSSPAGAP